MSPRSAWSKMAFLKSLRHKKPMRCEPRMEAGALGILKVSLMRARRCRRSAAYATVCIDQNDSLPVTIGHRNSFCRGVPVGLYSVLVIIGGGMNHDEKRDILDMTNVQSTV